MSRHSNSKGTSESILHFISVLHLLSPLPATLLPRVSFSLVFFSFHLTQLFFPSPLVHCVFVVSADRLHRMTFWLTMSVFFAFYATAAWRLSSCLTSLKDQILIEHSTAGMVKGHDFELQKHWVVIWVESRSVLRGALLTLLCLLIFVLNVYLCWPAYRMALFSG